MTNVAKKQIKSATVLLAKIRPSWVSLVEPDTTYNSDGSYGVGLQVTTDDQLEAINRATQLVGDSCGYAFPTYAVGDVIKTTMKAGGINRKTKVRWEDTPKVYNGDLTPADAATVKRISKKSLLNVSVIVRAYNPIGTPESEHYKPGGVNVKLSAIQIVNIDDGGPSAQELGLQPVTEDEDF